MAHSLIVFWQSPNRLAWIIVSVANVSAGQVDAFQNREKGLRNQETDLVMTVL
jgi:hypothetical protein